MCFLLCYDTDSYKLSSIDRERKLALSQLDLGP